MTIRSLFAALFLSLMTLPIWAQDVPRAEVALAYTYVHTNAPPGDCGCFSMNGGSGSFAFHFNPKFAAVADFGVVHAGNVDSTGLDLTLTSYLFGPRASYHLGTRLVPYVQVLAGAVHASGGLAPPNTIGATSSTSFAATVGGGLDFKLTHHIAIRPVQIEYFVTTLPNGADDHENNLRVSSGLVAHF